METNEIYEAFGLEVPEEPTQDTDTDTDTDVVTDVDTDNGGANDEGSVADNDVGGKEQTKEERAGYAAARRRAEAEAREREARAVKEAEERATINALKAVGAKNPYTGKVIETMEDLAAFREDQSKRAKQQIMRSTGQSDEDYLKTVDNLPEMVEAKEKLRAAEERAASAEAKIRESEDAEFKKALEEEIKRIAETGENVKTLEDITKLEKYPAIREKINRGYSLEDAYRSVYREEIEGRRSAVRAERAASAAASKSHLGRTSSTGGDTVSVPSDVLSQYHALMPNMSDADIAKHYAKHLKSKKK